ncbi:MAG TPA: phosphoglycerate kinase [Stellaceae bacterium]|jgi:phosphoglycerate kinase|nr:phosphoglycerate kinase [Stellaceae bacterium]
MPKNFLTLDELDVHGKRVLVRADLNVPVKDGVVTDATRIERLAPTVEALIGKGAAIVVLSHFGRPKGAPDPKLSLRPVVAALHRALGGREVAFAENCVGEEARQVVDRLRPGQVALLENLRFHPGEEENSPDFARALAALGEAYVDDAFSAAHRAHASIVALAQLLPAAAGRSMEAELDALSAALEHPAHPVMALVGGAKVSTKLDLLRFVVGKVDVLAIGGAMANTLLYAQGVGVGRSLCERDMAENARRLLALAAERNCRLILPEDAVVAAALSPGVASRTMPIGAVPADMMILDIGPATVARIGAALDEARTLVWNGPLGAFETPPFDRGTNAVAEKVAALTRAGRLRSVAGGGDTVAALAAAGLTDDLSYVSTAGGAFLEWLEGRELPGVAALAAAALKFRRRRGG